jgi:hypothetical protein
MNKTFLIPLLLLLAAAAIVVGLIVAMPAPEPPKPVAAAAPKPAPANVVELPEGVSPIDAMNVVMQQAAPTEVDLAAALRQEAEEEKLDPATRQILDQIESRAHDYTFDSYATLSGYLLNTNTRVRGAAIDALRAGGDETAAPLVRQRAAATTDPGVKAQLEELAEYLELPAYVPPSVRQGQ